MSEEEEVWDIGTPTRQSYLGVIIYLIRNLRALTTLLISFVAVAAAAPKFWTILGIAIVPLIILFALLAYWQYRNFTFHLEGDNLIINKGVFVKDRKSVPVERIQSIQVTKNVLQRILGLVALKVDTAGSRGNELEIPALEKERADALRDLLYARKEALTSEGEEVTSEKSVPQPHATTIADEESVTLVKLRLIDLIKVGLTENHLKTGFLALAFVFVYLNQYQELLQEYLEGYIDTYAAQVADAGLTLIISFLVFYALVSVALSMIRTFLRFYDLKAVLNREAVEINTGLLQKNEYRIPKNKVQFIQFETNPLRRLVGYESATLKPSNSVGEVGKKQTIEIPALQSVESNTLATGIFPDARQPEKFIIADHWAYARLYTLISLFLIVPICALLTWQFSFVGLTSLLFVLPFAAYGYRYGKTVRLFYDENFVYVKRGWLFPKKVILPSYKAQSLQLSQNIILKRRNIAHLTLFTAAGSKTVRFLHESDVLQLYNFLLKAVEKHEGSWM
ncbi:MAG: PH domain-containing protein [Bacteroidota bacterium]